MSLSPFSNDARIIYIPEIAIAEIKESLKNGVTFSFAKYNKFNSGESIFAVIGRYYYESMGQKISEYDSPNWDRLRVKLTNDERRNFLKKIEEIENSKSPSKNESQKIPWTDRYRPRP